MYVLILGGSRHDRRRVALEHVPATATAIPLDTLTLPFVRPGEVLMPPAPRVVLFEDVERAFPDPQSGSTRLVLTQSLYLLQTWIGLNRPAPGWPLRARAGRRAMETVRARRSIAATLAPDWEAVAYERGKLCLVNDDMAGARNAFQRAVDLMPTFSAAWSNLGATLGELHEPGAALIAFRHALAHDPLSFTIFNNIGVVCRELGQLDDSEAAFRRAIAINPAFVFGHYNLGHTLFLARNYPDALSAYEAGQRRDPQQSRRPGSRLAVVRFANGDVPGAERDLWRFADAAPPDEREALLLEAYEIVQALIAAHPALAPHRPFLDRIGAEIAKSE
ncbi:MAG: tetratricopeptide repeat protein [Vicinamibacterales bacterium]